MFRVHGCKFCFVSLLVAYICMRMTSTPRSIAGVLSGRVPQVSGYPIITHDTMISARVWWLQMISQMTLWSVTNDTYYCTPLVYVHGVIGGLAVWWHNKPKPNPECSRCGGYEKQNKNPGCLRVKTIAGVRDSFLGPTWLVGCAPHA